MENNLKLAIGGIVVSLGGIIALGILLAKCERIPPGAVGVSVKKCADGGVKKEPIPTGYYWRELFCEDVVEYPTNLQTLILSATDEDKKGDEITVTSIEGLPIRVDSALSFTLEGSKVPALYEKFRQDLEHLKYVFIRQTVREALQAIFSKYSAEELYSTKREVARAEAQAFLVEKLGGYGFLVAQFTINETRVPDQVVAAINGKVAMIQQAQQAEQAVRKAQAEAAQKVAAAEGESNSNIARARGEAESIRVRAEAQAKANELLGRSLTAEVIEYEKVRRWSGILPQVTGAVNPFVTVK